MKKIIMAREKIIESKEYLINPETLECDEEIWHNVDCEPFWNEYYRVCLWDTEEYEYPEDALNEEGEFFYDLQKAKEYYYKLEKELKEG